MVRQKRHNLRDQVEGRRIWAKVVRAAIDPIRASVGRTVAAMVGKGSHGLKRENTEGKN